MISIYRIVIYTINIPVFFLSKITPRKKRTWVFGSWFGMKYADNSKYLFEYVNAHRTDVNAVWLSVDNATVKQIREKGYKAHLSYSLAGYYYSLTASIGFICCWYSDINLFARPKHIINLWHGNPLKKIVHDDNKKKSKSTRDYFKELFFPFTKEDFSRATIICSSSTEAINMASAFSVSTDSIAITGLPRNEVFDQRIPRPLTKVIYMPTHRGEGKGCRVVRDSLEKNMLFIDRALKEIDVTLYVKLHHYEISESLTDTENIKVICDEEISGDIYSIINNMDALVTDYSSIYFDFLLSGKPIIFFPLDMAEYLNSDREFYYDYDNVAPGPKCMSWSAVLESIGALKTNPCLYQEERESIKNKFHAYTDRNYCKRIASLADNLS